eukprot:CAMPEP_0182915892 /NCGR_PEP_ID=MMETSP0105_2-20130417/605_1 /TAXON_ID=81532 ORGANISM="Acanthoeca-like sp., Strain 10tr" /NCGR_SAMPLE_ID=MMETSP0105_2 /ASSEMBLY_ACC=CAM_ASM_000205 /LENGTH=259 /DNA_ID=CAMNT_0025052791 /DNA_START=662 /DNA_END=1439 /DNA_ORIENTATION=-
MSTAAQCEVKAALKSTLSRVRVLALVFAISIACGNIALRYVFPSFTQVVASTTPIWTSMAAYHIQGVPQSPRSLLCIAGMCFGCGLAFWGEVNFHVIGFASIVCATALRGLKSVLGSILLTGEDSVDTLTLLHYTSQSAAVFLAVGSGTLEFPHMAKDPVFFEDGYEGLWLTIILSSCVAFFMNLCNLLVTFYTSAVTLSVLGNVKSVLVIIVSLGIFRNKISSLTIVGTFITLLSAGFYSHDKRQSHPHRTPPGRHHR